MDIDLLRTYVAFVDTGSFTRAARQTFRTQAAVSMQMKRLEEQVGRSLFRREGRSLELTDDGKQLVSYARRILDLHDEAIARFEPERSPPPLRIGCPDDYAHSLLPRLVTVLNERHPVLALKLYCAASNKLRQMMDEGELDLMIVTRAPGSDEGYLLLSDRGVWLRHPDFSWDGVAPLPLALYEADCKFHSAALDGLDKQHRAYRLLAASSSAAALLALVRGGMAMTAMATASRPPGLVVETEWGLPTLPGIEIALVLSSSPHPLTSTGWLQALICRFGEAQERAGQATMAAEPA